MATKSTQPAERKAPGMPDLCGELVQKIRKLEKRIETLQNESYRRAAQATAHELRDQALLEKKDAQILHLEKAYEQLAMAFKDSCEEIKGMKAEHPRLRFYVKKVGKTFAKASTQTEDRGELRKGVIHLRSEDKEKSEKDSDERDGSDEEDITFKGRHNLKDTEDAQVTLLFRGRRSIV